MQMVEINSKNVDSITREGKTYLYFTAGFSPFAAAMEPVYQKFLMEAEQYDVKVCRINVTDDIALGERFHVTCPLCWCSAMECGCTPPRVLCCRSITPIY